MRFKRITGLIALLLLVAGVQAFAQTTGTLIGNVTSDGIPLPGVTVTIISESLQGARTAITDINGNYKIGALPPGSYTVAFELEGLATVTRTVRVNVASTARADAAMSIGTIAEAITVTATPATVLETTEIQTNIQEDLVESLPMGRTITATVLLAPGVNDAGVGGNTMISGAPSYDSVYYVNGAVVNENLRGQPQALFIEDAVEETTVLTGGISAEFGRFTGGVVSTITKSGGNEFSGSLRDSFDSDDWREAYPTEDEVPNTDFSQVYEATLGGYIVRDRLWFFTAGRYFEEDGVEFFSRSTRTIPYTDEETRIELKLTGQITPNHSVVATLFDLDYPQSNYTFGSPAEISVAVDRNVPQRFWSANYSGVISSDLLIEALYGEKELTFEGSGGPAGSFVEATNVYLPQWNAWAGAPTFGRQGGASERDSDNLTLKGTYYLSTSSFGTHNIVAGYDDFTEMTLSNNHQSGSDFTVYSYATPQYTDSGELRIGMPQNGGFVIWWPILESSVGSDFQTQSFFVNDKWDFNSRLSFNIGARYDENNGRDQSGALVADDSKISPRLSATWDVLGDGRVRATASYAEYVSKIAAVGDDASPAGSPSILYWLYGGPTIAPTTTQNMLSQVWDWFQGIGGVDNRNPALLLGGGANGFSDQILGSLDSPSVEEFTIGVGSQIGSNGFLRIDYQNRNWSDFYVTELGLDNPIIEDPLIGGPIQVSYTTNSDDVTREYEAVLLQAGYRLTDRINVGAYYTWSELVGNYAGETEGSGPVTEFGGRYQPELIDYARRDPLGNLDEDRTHKLDAWISYDLPTPVGNFNFSLLQNYESGEPYEAVGTIALDQETCPQCRENPGYLFPEVDGNYYFEDRGESRLDAWTRTDLALNYALPIGRFEVFVQGEVFNVFNEDAVLDVDENVFTANDSQCPQCEPFDPFTETPVEGVHWIKGPNFGEPVNTNDYQLPRSWRFSAGFRF